MRLKLRKGPRDTWVGESPSRAELEEILGDQADDRRAVRRVDRRRARRVRIRPAAQGRAVRAGRDRHVRRPARPGHGVGEAHALPGRPARRGPDLGLRQGRHGHDQLRHRRCGARRPARCWPAGVPVGEILPGEGVRLEDGTFIAAPTVVSNADPKRVLGLVAGDAMPAEYRARLGAWDIRSPVVKFNAALSRLPSWTAAPGETFMARGTVDVTTGLDDAQAAFERCARGEPAVGFGEIYVQTLHDPSPAPAGKHLMSVFGQYAPYDAQRRLGHPPRRGRAAVHRPDLALRPRLRGLPRALRGARRAGHRAAGRPHRRAHLPGRGSSRPDVGAPAHAAHPDPRRLPVRRSHPPRRQRHRHQRPQRRRPPCSPTPARRRACVTTHPGSNAPLAGSRWFRTRSLANSGRKIWASGPMASA